MPHALDRREIEVLLGTRPVAKTDHFVLHCIAQNVVVKELSTEGAPSQDHSVDIVQTPASLGYAAVIPKRHARRSATRNLIKRQVRAQIRAKTAGCAPCHALVRLRSAFDPRHFPSASSVALRSAVRAELQVLLAQWKPSPCH